MVDEVTRWITDYGYWAVFLGTMIEGETAAFLSGIAAHNQLLSYPWAMLFAVLGGIASDNILFLVGRYAGTRVLPHFHRHRDKIIWAQGLIRQQENWVIIGVRFAYGMRTVGPIIIGASQVSPLKFIILNIMGGVIWGCGIVSIGYFMSSLVQSLPIHTYLAWLLVVIIIALMWIFIRRKGSDQFKK